MIAPSEKKYDPGMGSAPSTLRDSSVQSDDDSGVWDSAGSRQPGLVLIYSHDRPKWLVLPLGAEPLELGRESLGPLVSDERISRRHSTVSVQDGRILVRDHGSLNGTAVDGKPLAPGSCAAVERSLRIGATLFIPIADAQAFQRSQLVVQDGRVKGPLLIQRYLELARFASSSRTLYISGESGSGKEEAARAFHRAGPAGSGPFIAVNCATIAEGIAERLLFGAKRGAFSSANADVVGYVEAADHGTLFLDEVAELHASVQAKLLRVLESREVLPVGAVRPIPVELRLCSASHASLRAEVEAGRLRADLYYRIGRPEIIIPPLRERREEVPWLIAGELARLGCALPPHVSLVEACLLRHWPGNIRELLVEVNAAAQAAIASGSSRIEARHLGETAGQALQPAPAGAPPPLPPPPSDGARPPTPEPSPPVRRDGDIAKPEVEEMLRRTGGNVSRAAQALGVHRNTLRRLLRVYQIDVTALSGIIPRRPSRRATRAYRGPQDPIVH